MRGFFSSLTRFFRVGVKLSGGPVMGVVSSEITASNCATPHFGEGEGQEEEVHTLCLVLEEVDLIITSPWSFIWDWYGRHFDKMWTT